MRSFRLNNAAQLLLEVKQPIICLFRNDFLPLATAFIMGLASKCLQ